MYFVNLVLTKQHKSTFNCNAYQMLHPLNYVHTAQPSQYLHFECHRGINIIVRLITPQKKRFMHDGMFQ